MLLVKRHLPNIGAVILPAGFYWLGHPRRIVKLRYLVNWTRGNKCHHGVGFTSPRKRVRNSSNDASYRDAVVLVVLNPNEQIRRLDDTRRI